MSVESGYREDLAFIHDAGFGDMARDAAARLITELAGAACCPGTVVDFGCGSGILAEALAAAGYAVVGIDRSEAMVSLARNRVPGGNFQVGSFVSAAVPPSVAVTAVGEVVSYAFDAANNDSGRKEWFRRAYESLRPGGVLLFDVAGPGRVPPPGTARTFATGPDWTVLAETSIDPASRIVIRKIISFRRVGDLWRRDEEIHRLAIIDPAATLRTLREIGFEAEVIQSYGSAPLPPGVVAFLARKPVAGR